MYIFEVFMESSRTGLTNILVEQTTITSKFLDREVTIDAYLPLNVGTSGADEFIAYQ